MTHLCPNFRAGEVILIGLSIAISVSSQAAEHTIECPTKLEASAVQIVNPPEGWTPNVPSFFWLNTAAPMNGPPSHVADLKEDYSKRSGKKEVSRWDLGGGIGAYPDGKWLACKYGETNNLVLSRRIDDAATHCIVTQTSTGQRPDKVEVKCYW